MKLQTGLFAALLGSGTTTSSFPDSASGAQVTSTSPGEQSLPIPSLVTFGTGVIGGLFRPNSNADPAKARIAIPVMHLEQDYTTFYLCIELPVRGVQYLNDLADIDKVVLWGHSDGGAMMAAYQNAAENGASACNGTGKIYPCSSAMDNHLPANGVLLIDANSGLSTMTLLSLDLAKTMNQPTAGPRPAQTTQPHSRKDSCPASQPAGTASSPPRITFTRRPQNHKHPIRFLSTFAIRLTPDTFNITPTNITGIDWFSSQTATVGCTPGITKPLLTMKNTGHYEYLNAEKIYLAATGADDKSIAFVECARHTINTCEECEAYLGGFGDTVKTAFGFMDGWLAGEGRGFIFDLGRNGLLKETCSGGYCMDVFLCKYPECLNLGLTGLELVSDDMPGRLTAI
ncbi:hypothetical protein BJX70DRAFT_398145 [Aspergillus crustosus]